MTTPDLTATLDGYGVVKAVREAGLTGSVHLLVNQVPDAATADAVSHRITACATRFLGWAPEVLGHGRDRARDQAAVDRPLKYHERGAHDRDDRHEVVIPQFFEI